MKLLKLKAVLDIYLRDFYCPLYRFYCKSCFFCLLACKFFIMMSFLIVSAAVFLCPLVICSPCITNNLPPKPALVGHRGAPMVC